MRRILTLVLAFAFVLGLASAAAAQPPTNLGVGARALGMAGAFVAVADDGTAAYWNPAGITQIKVVGITPSLAVNGDFAIPPTSVDFSTFPPDVGNLDLQLDGMVGVVFKGIGLSLFLDADAYTYYDDTGINTVSGGDAKVIGTGMVTLAHEFADVFAVGVNLKVLYGQRMSFGANEGNPTGASYLEETATGYAADAGVMFKAGKLVRIGAVLENAFASGNWEGTSYSNFDGTVWTTQTPTSSPISLEQVLHVGIAIKPPVLGTLFAFQADNYLDSGIMTYRIGIEQSILVVKLRAGAYLNEDFDVMQYTAGVGFKLGPVVLDVGAVSDQDLALQTAVLTAGFTF